MLQEFQVVVLQNRYGKILCYVNITERKWSLVQQIQIFQQVPQSKVQMQ